MIDDDDTDESMDEYVEDALDDSNGDLEDMDELTTELD